MGEVTIALWIWLHGQKLCVTDDQSRVPLYADKIVQEIKVPIAAFGPTSTPGEARETFRQQRLWLLMLRCPRFEVEI